MHTCCWLWDAAHSWVVNNTRGNHPQPLKHTCVQDCSEISVFIRAHTNMQCENDVYWWRVAGFVRAGEAVHQVTVVVISSRAWRQNSLNFFQATAQAYAYKPHRLRRIVSSVSGPSLIPRHKHTKSTVSFVFSLSSLLTLRFPSHLFMTRPQLSFLRRYRLSSPPSHSPRTAFDMTWFLMHFGNFSRAAAEYTPCNFAPRAINRQMGFVRVLPD